MINGLNAIAVTKLDVLTGIKRLKVAVGYKWRGKILRRCPIDEERLGEVRVVYKNLSGWEEDITKVRRFQQLPKAAREYIQMIEELTGVPVEMIGVGPGREELIKRSDYS